MRHRNQLNLVKHRQLRSARLPAIGPIGDDSLNAGGDGRMCRVCGEFKEWEGFGSFEWTCIECRREAGDAAAHKAVQAPAQTVFAVGDTVRDCAGVERIVARCFKRNAPGGIAHNDWLFHDAEYARREEGKGDAAHGYLVDYFELVRRAGEVRGCACRGSTVGTLDRPVKHTPEGCAGDVKADELPAGWRDESWELHEADRALGDKLYRHDKRACVRLNGRVDPSTKQRWTADWWVYPGGGLGHRSDAATRNEAMRLALEGPSA